MKTPKKLIKRTREVVETPYGKNIQTTLYNRLTKKGVSKEKDITYRTKDEPRIKYVDKQVVRRDKDLNWKSSKETKKVEEGVIDSIRSIIGSLLSKIGIRRKKIESELESLRKIMKPSFREFIKK